ncbi:hypothetical protein CEP54_006476 [Fusarium duplospermum]|uniref:NAD(P)-binding domain-containing protein n=1 Tax=Fusarium duplospermum TaxID=1325734 RepID=A0A428Q6V4_9HYPO|nr:hypothetical protein CEP54_006476 [Fusarium duplospermum]
MHLLILGATGRTGIFGYKYALEQGRLVTAIVRSSQSLVPHKNLRMTEGSVTSLKDVENAIRTSQSPIDAVLSFLNPHVTSGLWPKFVGPPRLMADAAANTSRAFRQSGLQNSTSKPRLVVMSAVGVAESRNAAPWLATFMVDHHSNTNKLYQDHEAVRTEIEENCGDEISWTLVYAVGLGTSGVKQVKTFRPTEIGASWYITRESAARWMVDVAVGKMGERFSNQAVIVSN